MSDWVVDSRRRDGVTLPTIWVAMAASLLLHVAVLWPWLPQLRLLSLDNPERGPASATLAVRLVPQPSLPSSSPPPAPPSSPALRAPASPPRRARRPRAAVHRSAPPVIALERHAPDTQSLPQATQSTAVPAPSPAEGDLTSYIEAKRRARAASAPAASPGIESNTPTAEDDDARRNRVVAANLGLGRTPTFGGDPSHSGGIFQIKRIGYSDAEFLFFGWSKDIRRNTNQLIEVRKGDNSDIRIAVVRKMIAIIRQYESRDFLWESKRLDRDITLSARPEDNAGLEEFMMREFFDATRPQ